MGIGCSRSEVEVRCADVFAGAKGACLRQGVLQGEVGRWGGYLCEISFFATFAMCKMKRKIWAGSSVSA